MKAPQGSLGSEGGLESGLELEAAAGGTGRGPWLLASASDSAVLLRSMS